MTQALDIKAAVKERINALWLQYFKAKDMPARDQLIEHYLHLVKYVVHRVMSTLPSYVDQDDMYSTGVMGLIKAVEKFDPTKGAKFETYACLLIRGSIIDEMRQMDWVPRSVHQKAHEIQDAEKDLQGRLGREPTAIELAKHLGITTKQLEILRERTAPAVNMSLNQNAEEDSERGSLADRIADTQARTSYETADRNEFATLVENAILDLPEKERMILVLYYYENLMLKDIGEVLGVTESRVSQLHAKAILTLRTKLRQVAKEFSDFG